MKSHIDIRGMNLIQSWSVIKDRLYNAGKSSLITVTDNPDVVNYIRRMAETMGTQTSIDHIGSNYYIHLADQTRLAEPDDFFPPSGNVVVITGDTLGKGDETLGKVLLKSFIYQLQYLNPLPKCIIFINKGIFLAMKGSDTLECIKSLSERGVKVLLSSACLCYYNCKEELEVGKAADMKEITNRMNNAKNTIVI